MKINSRDLFDYINGYLDNKEAKFKVFHNGNYVTDIFWDGENFNWDSGTFTSGAFFDQLYNFYLIEEDKQIEKLPIWATRREDKEYTNLEEHILVVARKVDELICKVNNMENNK